MKKNSYLASTDAFAWIRNPSAPAPSADDISRAEAAAWRSAYALAAANPGTPVTVYKCKGEWLALKRGDPVPARARPRGTIGDR